jgi:hypothetical protein
VRKSLLSGEQVNRAEFHEESFQERLALARKMGLSCFSKQSPAGKRIDPERNDFSGPGNPLFF